MELNKPKVAYCDHALCPGPNMKRNIPQGQRRCPDCPNALEWEPEPRNRDKKRLRREACEHEWALKEYNYGKCVYKHKYCPKCKITKSNWDNGWETWNL